jgi:transposase-like protein
MEHGTRDRQHPQRPERVSLGELIHQHVRVAVEQAVQEELAALLGAGRYERCARRIGYRNGHKRRTLTGPTGPLGLTLPRALVFTPRGPKEWVSTVVPRYQRRLREVNTAVTMTYLAVTSGLKRRQGSCGVRAGSPKG